MAYTQIRYIGYQIATVGLANPTVYGIAPGVVNSPPPLTGVTSDLSADARVRVERLIGAMLRAYARIQTSDNKQTLKIFIAPEFYFRPNNTEVSYTMKEYRAIKNVLRETIGGDDRFTDWLVIPGTIMWKMTAGDSSSKRAISVLNRRVYFNTTLYIKKSNDPKVKSSKVIEKVSASNIDGIPTGRHGGTYADDPTKKSAPVEFPRYEDSEHKSKHIFQICGLTVGLEICLEHSLQVLKTVLHNQYKLYRRFGNLGALARIDLHLLTAGGMDLIRGSIAAKINGFFLRCDGYIDPRDPNEKAVEMYEITAYDDATRGPALQTSAVSSMEDIMTAYNPTSVDIGVTDNLYLPPPPSCTTTWTPQKLHVFPSLPLP